jgi:alpha-L-rhamnosidase
MTRFSQNTQWTQRANFVELPTDCPQRDERLGWMGDAQVYVRTATYWADVAAFFTKWFADVREAQRDSGPYPDYCPYPMAHGNPGATHGTAWTDAGVLCPWTLWQVYGDTRVLEQHWDSMRRFMAWRHQVDPQLQGVNLGNTWGDWLNLNEPTPIEYVDLCYHALDAQRMSEMAEALGRAEEAAQFHQRFADARRSFQQRYLRPNGSLSVDTQTAYVLALWVNLIPAPLAAQSAQALADKIRKNEDRMTTGFLGTKPLLGVLTQYGHHDLAVQLFQSRRFPSWGYEVVNGATTVWERWDSYTREHGFNGASGDQNASMNSFSHYAFGAVMEWAFRDLAGIDAATPGYREILLRPRIPRATTAPGVPSLDWVRAEYGSPRGPIAAAWRRQGRRVTLNVTIPANTKATLIVPAQSPEDLTEQGQPLQRVEGVRRLTSAAGQTSLEVGSGTYHFETIW